ncbi:hypothetical protein M0D69_39240 [Caballeronia sp. SEWSISQ10-4 2]|uniref:hypothetical protein n=1 Tax=Caballeronia sp. SEWSISQ10-4 2 TaxID=2937438 RepID=UPI002654E49C|nr:hypothetical protein [Caballeronia sp. SEWSISQ10-4 2]MDN7183947.1 hypothetical protein [Caballeronia sp. SEWSISQ10-4 2]
MAVILIKDLPDSVELDKQAMSAIVGGARSSAHQALRWYAKPASSTRIVNFPASQIGVTVPQPTAKTTGRKARK